MICCGVCMYGANAKKYPEGGKCECMINGYQVKSNADNCKSFIRDYKKNIEVVSIKSATSRKKSKKHVNATK